MVGTSILSVNCFQNATVSPALPKQVLLSIAKSSEMNMKKKKVLYNFLTSKQRHSQMKKMEKIPAIWNGRTIWNQSKG